MCDAFAARAVCYDAALHGAWLLPRDAALIFLRHVAESRYRGTTMLYAVIATDAPNSLQDRLATRPAHLARLEQLKNEGRLVLAGPHPAIDSNDPGEAGFSGSLVVAEFDSLEAAQQWADADPYKAAGVYVNVLVKPFKKVLP
jgi:uncharacterized protein YciI